MADKMREEYAPRDFETRVAYLVEECGETVAAAGKTLRFGRHSANPELPPEERETNEDWLRRELRDLKRAIAYVEEELSP